jgi:hypothetical protein
VPLSLANDLVSRREWNEMGEAFHGDCIAVLDGRFHGLGETKKTRHDMNPEIAD